MEEITKRTEDVEIDLMELFHILLRKAWLIAICLIVGAVAMGGYTKIFVTPQYSATSTIYILSSTTSITSVADLQLGTQLTADFAEIAKSRPVVEAVIEELGLKDSYGSLAGRLSTVNPEGTHMLKLTATDSNPKMAAEISNAYAEIMTEQIADIMNTDKPNIAEKAVAPSAPSSPNLKKNIFMGAVAGAALACLAILIQFMLNDTIRTEEDVRKYLGMNTLAVMPLERRRKAS